MKSNIVIFSKRFLIIYLLLFVICIFSVNEVYMPLSIVNALIDTTFGRMFPIFLFLLLSISSYKLLILYNKNYYVFLRFQNKKIYVNQLIKYIFLNLLLLYIFIIFFVIVFVIVNHLLLGYVFNFSIISFLYYLYMCVKVFVIYWLLIKISIIIFKGFSITISGLYLVIILILKDGYQYSLQTISTFKEIPLFYGYYLFFLEYDNIFLDIFSFLLQVIILTVIGDILKNVIYKYKKIYLED